MKTKILCIDGTIYELREFNKDYYISPYGDIYSVRNKKFVKHSITSSFHHRVDIYGKHKAIHRMVYQLWIGDIEKGMQINHKDDNPGNNYYKNLYQGTQKQNIDDCFRNNHRVGHIYVFKVYDKHNKQYLTFFPATKFNIYLNRKGKSGGLKKIIKTKWFKKKYKLIEYKRVTTIEELNEIKKSSSFVE